ncbi:zinc finger CCCH domain-containing protein 3 isoform X2 [Thalassophryne amazonica]|uniref:zinc finger CCCH domain-containing protein 3 isoform X2 n=1 Tax=Thalassophryne amazonica TaxID=390379 RepID=UPI0014721946|nr:zinc finger CCCH domain-containing protein 3 isoform X2 [Thalassophryne amazonica]
MEEKESLKRQIELLQNLINRHKSIHGDVPCPGGEQRDSEVPASSMGRGQNSSVIHPHSSRGNPYVLQNRGSWRKTYSLNNKNTQPTASTSYSYPQWSSPGGYNSISLPSHRQKYVSDKTLLSRVPQQKKEEHLKITKVKEAAEDYKSTGRKTGKEAAEFQNQVVGTGASETGTGKQGEGILPVLLQKKSMDSTGRPSSLKINSLTKFQSSPHVQMDSSLMRKTSTETKQTVSVVIPTNITAGIKTPPKVLQQFPKSQISQVPVSASFSQKHSKFTWVKNQNTGGDGYKCASSVFQGTKEGLSATPVAMSKAKVYIGSPLLFSASKKTPARKLPRKLSLVNTAPKISKYTWISSSSGTQARISRKSPKSFTIAQRPVEKGEAVKKLRSGSPYSAKVKKATASPPISTSISSRYRWKAGAQGPSAAVAAVATVARRRSAFHWTSERSLRGVKGGLVVSPTLPQRAFIPSSSPAGFKLRSRMKIIRKSASSGCGSEKSSSPMVSTRGRIHTGTKTPAGVRRTPSRELVSFGRHKLRRLSPSFSRTSPSVLADRSPASQRVFRTRYKMVTRPGSGTVPTLHYNPALSWRTRRIHSARTFLQSRLRAPHHRHPSPTQHWRGTNMCWIGDSLYRVSANKLSRTTATSLSINQTGRWAAPSLSSPTSPLGRTFSSRQMASRAVQRSIAIIRHAHQKKQQKQYCMYYNRFGKCNRGNSCPYIHDPDKVAVCTRFLRGTCKPVAGTCPFSHKVAKEKMPVCSYFLKGICNNSDCPYSHVYVSRKAEVCQDFVKGYCPEGEKCKKKHTLLCPDFSKNGSCPRGSRCKLQHHQRAKRAASNTAGTATKRARVKETTKRPRLHVVIPQVDDTQAAPGTPAARPLELPAFISLSSSPEEAESPDRKSAEMSQVKEKKLQIKPRL